MIRIPCPLVRLAAAALAALAAVRPGAPAAAQLRPIEPAAWDVFEPGRVLAATAGVGVHERQRAALAGTEGRLLELGNFQLAWRSGRIAVEASGTALRVFADETSFAPPGEGVSDVGGENRTDAGDYRISTSVLLTPPGARAQAMVRFGTRLPTSDNTVGLDRDRTDFFALAGGRVRGGRLRLAGEAGVGIFGTRNESHEQSDALVYSLSAEYAVGPMTPALLLLGHADPFDAWTPRGNEDLTELRAGARVGGRYWLQAQWVKGLMEYSPGAGVLVSAGVSR